MHQLFGQPLLVYVKLWHIIIYINWLYEGQLLAQVQIRGKEIQFITPIKVACDNLFISTVANS